jgi:hypothetical protein
MVWFKMLPAAFSISKKFVMKKIFLFALLLSFICFHSWAGHPASKENSDGESTKVSLYIPGFLLKTGSWLMNEKTAPEA